MCITPHTLNIQFSVESSEDTGQRGGKCIFLQTVYYFTIVHYDGAFMSTRLPFISFVKG